MNMICINATLSAERRVASLIDHQLEYLDIEDTTQYRQKSNIYAAVVTSVEASLDAVFVEYGGTRHGFLPYKEIADEYLVKAKDDKNNRPPISDGKTFNIEKGTKMLVQIEKEQRGSKGAALSTFISLAGAYLVLMPNNPSGGGISKRVDTSSRDQTRDLIDQLPIPESMSVIVRTAGVGRSLEELKWDLEILLNHWNSIQEAFKEAKPPTLIHKESDVITRAIRDHLKPNISQIIVDDPKTFYEVSEFLQKTRPDFADRLTLHTNKVPLFTHYQIEEKIDKLFASKIDLPSGGSIVIDDTEALTAIDVNSASMTKGSNIEETAYKINLEAAEEAIRQIRLRDIGGIIIIDFIDMTSKEHKAAIHNKVTKYLSTDKARSHVKEISDLSGIMEISRQRLAPPLSESHLTTCPHCQGQGLVRNTTGFGNSILRKIEQTAVGSTCDLIQVQAPVDTANYILNTRRNDIESIKKRFNVEICILANPQITSQRFLLKRMKLENSSLPAHQLEDKPIDESTPSWQTDQQQASAPMINKNMPTHPKTETSKGILQKIWNALFSSDDKKAQNKGKSSTNRRRNTRNTRGKGPNQRRNTNQQGENRTGTGGNRSRNRSGNRQRRRQNSDQETTQH